MRYSIVGMNHQGTEAIVAELKPGVAVTLVRELDNKFDKNAVAVLVDGVRVGYVAKNQNSTLARHIDSAGHNWTGPSLLGLDEKSGTATSTANDRKAIDAMFARSPNSGYPQVEVVS